MSMKFMGRGSGAVSWDDRGIAKADGRRKAIATIANGCEEDFHLDRDMVTSDLYGSGSNEREYDGLLCRGSSSPGRKRTCHMGRPTR
jgi:hypothetical protein